jgi:2-polyprenyl-3-methyl-5-hydroxy-6-metoxy-1,4-benzoquinol methylase
VTSYVGNFDLDELGVAAGSDVVDLGCAEGVFARRLAAAGLRVTGVEPEPRLRERFMSEAANTGHVSSLRVVDGTAEALPFPSASVEALVMTEVLEHVADPSSCLKEIARVVRPGGRVCLSVPTGPSERVFSTLHPRYLRNATHLRIFKKRDLIDLVEDSGLRVLRVEGRNFRASLSWVFHALLRSKSDHAGRIHDHLWVDRALDYLWAALTRIRLSDPLTRVGDRVFPKSWYLYAERPPD